MKGFMYILQCADGSYYTGSTIDLDARLIQHENGEGANYTKNRLPVKLVYYEEYDRIDDAFYREKQVQGWSRKKKDALINGNPELLPKLAIAYRDLRKDGMEALSGLREPQAPTFREPLVLTFREPQFKVNGRDFQKMVAEAGTRGSMKATRRWLRRGICWWLRLSTVAEALEASHQKHGGLSLLGKGRAFESLRHQPIENFN
jgi:putative endonuclease